MWNKHWFLYYMLNYIECIGHAIYQSISIDKWFIAGVYMYEDSQYHLMKKPLIEYHNMWTCEKKTFSTEKKNLEKIFNDLISPIGLFLKHRAFLNFINHLSVQEDILGRNPIKEKYKIATDGYANLYLSTWFSKLW